MKKARLIICIAAALVGCSRQTPPPPHPETRLSREFEPEFVRLFLSQDPLRYQDNVEFLSSIKEAQLNAKDRERVRTKLKAFLFAEPKARPYTPDSWHKGVASEISFLRLQAVQVLAEIGAKEDAAFIRGLDARADEHPMFDEECQKAVTRLEAR